MIRLVFKYIMSSMRVDIKKIMIMSLGIILSTTLIMNYLYLIFIDDYSKEKINEANNYRKAVFSSTEEILEVTDYLKDIDQIGDVSIEYFFESFTFGLNITAYVTEYKVDERRIDIGELITNDDTGKIVVSSMAKSIIDARMGKSITLSNKNYICSAIINIVDFDVLLTVDDIIDLFNKKGGNTISVKYTYDNGTKDDKLAEIGDEIMERFNANEIVVPQNITLVSADLAVDSLKLVFPMIVLSVLSYMMIFLVMLELRSKHYNILRIIGATKLKIMSAIFTELVVIFTLSYVVSVAIFTIYLQITGKLMYNLITIYTVTYLVFFVINVIVGFFATIRIRRQTPFEYYKRVE